MNKVHFAIPEIYGETLSYYELLRKLVDKTNELIENYNTVPEQIADEVKKLDAYNVFTTALNWIIHSIATDNTKSKDAVKQYKKHDLLYATFNDTVNLYEAITDFTNVFLTELKVGENIREVNISELLIELRNLIDTNKNNIESVTAVANENSAEITTMRNDITSIENKNTEQDNELSTLRTMVSSPYNFKGDVASISALPARGNINDTYYVQDVKYKVTWTGSAWVQSSLSEADYQTELSELNGDLFDLSKGIMKPKVIWKIGGFYGDSGIFNPRNDAIVCENVNLDDFPTITAFVDNGYEVSYGYLLNETWHFVGTYDSAFVFAPTKNAKYKIMVASKNGEQASIDTFSSKIIINRKVGFFTNQVSVTDFGALGDGKTDDTIAFENALLYAKNNNIRNIYIPKGEYLISFLHVDFDINVYGDGINKSILIEKSLNEKESLISVDGNIMWFTLKSIMLKGKNQGNNAVKFENGENVCSCWAVVEDVWIQDFNKTGIYIENKRTTIKINRCSIQACGSGVKLYSADNVITNTDVGSCSGYAIEVSDSANKIDNCSIYGSYYGVFLNSGANFTQIINCSIDRNKVHGLAVLGSRNIISNCLIYGNNATSQNGSDIVIYSAGNSITNCQSVVITTLGWVPDNHILLSQESNGNFVSVMVDELASKGALLDNGSNNVIYLNGIKNKTN